MMTPKMRAELDEEITKAARQLFLSSRICEICKETATPNKRNFFCMCCGKSCGCVSRTSTSA